MYDLKLIMRAIEIDRAGLADGKMHAVGNTIDVDTNRDALSEAHPCKHRIHFRQTLRVRSGVAVGDSAIDAFHMSEQFDPGIAHQFGPGGGADADVAQSCFLEVAGYPV